jgi:capsular exopolysaccharide synthesis family protein
VPHIEADQGLLDDNEKATKSILEPFRALRATLKHLATVHKAKVFILCSAVKGEGKTTLSVNLSLTFAIDGKKVILIDGDLRRSQIHHYVNVPKEIGFYDYLKGEKTLDEIIKPTHHENLFVITSGERPHNPAELLGTYRFDEMMTEIRDKADIIILDSPALLPVSDSLIMAPKADACIMVVRTLWTPLRAARQAKNQLKRMGTKILGCILNGVPHSKGYYPYYYGYYGYYSYRYSYEDEPKKRFSLRDIGLKSEELLKSGFENFRFGMPRYFSLAATFVRRISRKPLFWLLLGLFCLATILRLSFHKQGNSTGWGKKKVAQSFISMEQALPRQEASDPYAEHRSAVDVVSPEPATDAVGHEVIESWLSSIRSRDMRRYREFYDSTAFKFDGGDFDAWIEDTKKKWLSQASRRDILTIDSLTERSISDIYREVSFIALEQADGDTVKNRITVVWQWEGSSWRIIRQKSQGGQ